MEWYHPHQQERILDWLPRAATIQALTTRIFPLLKLSQLAAVLGNTRNSTETFNGITKGKSWLFYVSSELLERCMATFSGVPSPGDVGVRFKVPTCP